MIHCHAVTSNGIQDRKIEVSIGRCQFQEKVLSPFEYLVDACVATVNFIDHHDGLQVKFQRLLQHKARLWHRPLHGIDEQDAAISHVEYALDLTAKISVSGSINNIDFNTAIDNGRIFSQDGDSALTLLVVRIHDEFAHLLVLAEDMALLEQAIYQRRFTMVDVSNNGDIANIVSFY